MNVAELNFEGEPLECVGLFPVDADSAVGLLHQNLITVLSLRGQCESDEAVSGNEPISASLVWQTALIEFGDADDLAEYRSE